jgi:hypothetical protein
MFSFFLAGILWLYRINDTGILPKKAEAGRIDPTAKILR